MKRLPESELEIMMIIWRHGEPMNRMEIEAQLEKKVAAPTVQDMEDLADFLEEKGRTAEKKESGAEGSRF